MGTTAPILSAGLCCRHLPLGQESAQHPMLPPIKAPVPLYTAIQKQKRQHDAGHGSWPSHWEGKTYTPAQLHCQMMEDKVNVEGSLGVGMFVEGAQEEGDLRDRQTRLDRRI